MLVKKIEFRKPLNTAASKHIKLYNNFSEDLNKCVFLFGEEEIAIPG